VPINDLNEYIESNNYENEKSKKNIKKVFKALDNKTNYESLLEINDKIKLLADKQIVLELENSIFPILNSIIDATKSFQKEISSSKSQQIRFDELISDKASKFELKQIRDKIDLCVTHKV